LHCRLQGSIRAGEALQGFEGKSIILLSGIIRALVEVAFPLQVASIQYRGTLPVAVICQRHQVAGSHRDIPLPVSGKPRVRRAVKAYRRIGVIRIDRGNEQGITGLVIDIKPAVLRKEGVSEYPDAGIGE
jgi:hypothetical protein